MGRWMRGWVFVAVRIGDGRNVQVQESAGDVQMRREGRLWKEQAAVS